MAIFFNVGDEISLYGTNYTVKGKITFSSNNSEWWDEYKIVSGLGKEHWLSIDGDEITLWQTTSYVNISNMKLLDSGTKKAVACFGDVDVDRGEKANYKEYKKSHSDYIEIETWNDETEYSLGKICSSNSITIIKRSSTRIGSARFLSEKKVIGGVLILGILSVIFTIFCFSPKLNLKHKIDSDNTNYKFETAITGLENKTADIYTSTESSDYVAKDIIKKIEGDIEYVQENPLDTNTIAILTKDEMCIVYRSSVNNSTLVHLAERKWTFNNLDAPLYAADSITDDFYRSFYEYTAFASDSCQYKSSNSNHSHFHTHGVHFPIFYGCSNSRYNSYASTVRESSLSRRTSSGGGSSGGGK